MQCNHKFFFICLALSTALATAVACGDNIGVDVAAQPDAGPPADGPSAPVIASIADARAAADGAVALSLEDVLVTYLKPSFDSEDPAGFFIQDSQTGPALFVSVDPSSLTPALAAGDNIDFRITEMATLNELRHASAITSVTVNSQGNDLSGLVQDISSATDVVSALGDYEGELVTASFTVVDDIGGGGAGYDQAEVDTAMITGDSNLRFRVPDGLQDSLSLLIGCAIEINPTPLWRFNGVAQLSAWSLADIDIANSTCPATRTVKAFATSETEVRIDFGRGLDATSVMGNGSQITFDNGLTVSGATVDGSQLIITTVADMTPGTLYTVTVDTAITDILGVAIDDTSSANAATYSGWDPGIDDLLAAPTGTVDFTVTGALVTYLKPALGDDVAGFFIQKQSPGPAMFIAVDPATTTPPLAVGDNIDIQITETEFASGLVQGATIGTLTRNSQGNDVTALSQDISARDDVVRALDNYAAEIVTVTANITGDFSSAGDEHQAAEIETTGLTGESNLRLRLPNTLIDGFDLRSGCSFTATAVPMWRFFSAAQISAYEESQINPTCPAPQVVGAVPTGVEEIVVTFSRKLDAATVAAGDFTADGGLTFDAVVASDTTVTLTTSTQTEGLTYTVTVTGIDDVLGKTVDPAANSATFAGFTPPDPTVIINEVDYDQDGTDNAEFVELYNPGASDFSLANLSLVFINGSNNEQYRAVDLSTLSGGMLPGNGYLVIDLPSNGIQNGAPDGLAVVNTMTEAVLDALSYEGEITEAQVDGFSGTINLVEGNAATVSDSNSVTGSLSRIPSGVDTNDAATDWKFTETLTKGAKN